MQDQSLAESIQRDLLDPSVSLADILRKAKVLAFRLGHDEFKAWIDNELNGYDDDPVPDYRVIHNPPAFMDLVGPLGSGQKNVILPIIGMSDTVRSWADSVVFSSGVRQLESLVTGSTGTLYRKWPAEIRMLAQDRLDTGPFQIADITQHIPVPAVDGILDIVRTRLLEFLLQLGQISPEIFTSDAALSEVEAASVSNAYSVSIVGDGNVVATGSATAQSATLSFAAGDTAGLCDYLRTIGVADSDIQDLLSATNDEASQPKDQLGPRVQKWVGRMVSKASSGAWDVSMKVAPQLIMKALGKFYGWE